MSLMVSISGIRGVVGESLTPASVTKYAAGFADYCMRTTAGRPTVVIGRDGRITGEMIVDLVSGTLRAKGVDVRDIGICPTPTVQIAVEKLKAAGGIAVTASHNPMKWNGLKFMAATGMFLNGAENKAFWDLAETTSPYAGWETAGTLVRDDSWLTKHVEAVLGLRMIDLPVVRERKFKVVLDSVNAAGGLIVPALLEQLGCHVIPMNCEVSGVFAHTPEPIPENLTTVAARVKAEKADLGICVDPDVDRLVLMTEKGEPYGEEYTIASAVEFVLGRLAGTRGGNPFYVVANLSTTRAVDDIARRRSAVVVRTPVGEINVATKMKEIGAVIGGEGSGGVILPDVHLGRDAIVGIGLILQLLAESGKTLSGLKETLPQYSIAKGKLDLGAVTPEGLLDRVRDAHAREGKINTDDGLKMDFDDYWVHLRKSNTEPIIRIIAEAPTMERAAAVVETFRKEIVSLLPRR